MKGISINDLKPMDRLMLRISYKRAQWFTVNCIDYLEERLRLDDNKNQFIDVNFSSIQPDLNDVWFYGESKQIQMRREHNILARLLMRESNELMQESQ